MNSVCWILFVVIILSTWRDSLGQGNCELNYSLIQSKEGEYRRFIDELNGTLIDPEELVIEDDFNLIHFQYTVDLSRRIFDEQLAKLRGEIRKDQREIPHFEETIGGVTETKSKCSAVCGEGVRHVTEITCENGRNLDNCTQPKFVTRLEPCFPIFGCPTVAFGEWGGWSSCSQSCIESLNDIPYRVRVRTCTPNCQFGNIEKRPCDLPMCPPTCPEYTATLDRNTKEDLKISVLFTIDPPKRTIGQNSRQEVSLRDFYDGSLVETFNVTYHKTIQKTSLRINSAYVPEIRIINEIFLRSPHSNPTSLLVHHCQGRVLHCNFFICDDGTRILADELCNNKVNCPDLSDERADRCTGSFGIPLITLTLFLFVYIIIGVGLFLSRNKEEFFMKDEPSKTPQELELLRHEYANLHINKSTEEFLHLYANDRQVLLEVVRPMELEAHEQVVYKALECLKDSHVIAGGNMIIMGSFSGKIKALIPYRVRRIATALKYCFKSASFYFDIYKDIALIFALMHISREILNFRFGNDLRLDVLAYYILGMILLSQFCVHVYSFTQRWNEQDKWTALIFPIHNAFDKSDLLAELQLMETFLERVPQLMVILCLWNESEENPRLGLFLFSIFDGKLGLSAKAIFIFSVVTTYIGIIRSVINVYNRKRYPLTPSGTGQIIQYFLFSSLLIPKTLVGSWIFRHYPFCFPLSVVMEMFLISLIYKTPLPFTRIKPCSLEMVCASVVVPAFYRESRFCILQNLCLFFISWALIYIPCDILFKDILGLDPYSVYSIEEFIYPSLFCYGIGALLYALFAFLYYFYGHNWSSIIRATHLSRSLNNVHNKNT